MSQVKQKKNRSVLIEKNQKTPRQRSKRPCENCASSEERIKNLQTALKEVIDQNEALRCHIAELEAQISDVSEQILCKQALISP